MRRFGHLRPLLGSRAPPDRLHSGEKRASCAGQDVLRLPEVQQSPMSFAPIVTLSDLESHLWEFANILRGPADAADFKTYIFPLLFFKRICEVWDDEWRRDQQRTTGLVPRRIASLRDPQGLPLERRAHQGNEHRGSTSARHAVDREGQSRYPVRLGRRRPVVQQGTPVRRAVEEPARALLEAAFGNSRRCLPSSGWRQVAEPDQGARGRRHK